MRERDNLVTRKEVPVCSLVTGAQYTRRGLSNLTALLSTRYTS